MDPLQERAGQCCERYSSGARSHEGQAARVAQACASGAAAVMSFERFAQRIEPGVHVADGLQDGRLLPGVSSSIGSPARTPFSIAKAAVTSSARPIAKSWSTIHHTSVSLTWIAAIWVTSRTS